MSSSLGSPNHDVEEMLLQAGFCLDHDEQGGNDCRPRVRAELARMRAAGLREGRTGDFDPVDVVQKLVTEGLNDAASLWRTQFVRTGQRLVQTLCGTGTDAVPDVQRLAPRRFMVSFERTFDMSHCRGTHARLRIPRPIEDAQLHDLHIEPAPGSVHLTAAAGRLEAKVPLDGTRHATIGARFTFAADPHQPQDPAPPHARWLDATEGGSLVTDRVLALAAALDPGGGSLARLLRFRAHLLENFLCTPIAYETVSASPLDRVLDDARFDCRLGALLLIALCRAVGIPARLAGGYLLWDAPMEHFWMEAWIDGQGWTPVDLLAWDLSAGGQDSRWRDIYVGALDYRMKTQVLPQIFIGAPGVPMPPAWRRLTRSVPGGTVSSMISAADGSLIYSDDIRVVRD